ncbi:MAG: deoxyribodipyrimidine photo-lyase [Alphaproteobacteria bacterium]|nr:deoxyribodipyrimidine photo-lyase [Alphaproteobacteria bacterium]
MDSAPSIVWFRQDLRLADNPALHAAAETNRRLVLLYVLDDETPGRWRMGGAARWWLHHSLAALGASLEPFGIQLVLRRGRASTVVPEIVAECGAGAIFWNRCYEPFAVARDAALKAQFTARDLDVRTFNGSLLCEPWMVKTKTGEPFKVFTPFWRACLTQEVRAPIPTPKRLRPHARIRSDDLAAWKLLPSRPNWAKAFPWQPGEAFALNRLRAFVDAQLASYQEGRDQLGVIGTSQLSAHLRFGEITPAQIYNIIGDGAGSETYLKEIIWREFSYNLLYHWPDIAEANWKKPFDRFPWRDDAEGLRAWCEGRTGYPVVDAAMRELWTTGYMHNRARMIAASFLTKHLLIDWRRGEEWFWDTLVDADLANNAASWQWVAGSGADAAPYFRIFNPVAQGERFDADGAYVRRWLPELARLPNEFVHKPWQADHATMRAANVDLGNTYPHPSVDHAAARARALSAYASIASSSA